MLTNIFLICRSDAIRLLVSEKWFWSPPESGGSSLLVFPYKYISPTDHIGSVAILTIEAMPYNRKDTFTSKRQFFCHTCQQINGQTSQASSARVKYEKYFV